MRKGLKAGIFGLLIGALVLAAAGCGGKKSSSSSSSGGATALPASSCSDIYYEGTGKPDCIIASDLPLQGSGRTQTVQMTEAIKFILKQDGFKAGNYTVGYQSCDDSTAQAGKWDSGQVLGERQRLRRQQERHRRDRDVQLGLRRDRSSRC